MVENRSGFNGHPVHKRRKIKNHISIAFIRLVPGEEKSKIFLRGLTSPELKKYFCGPKRGELWEFWQDSKLSTVSVLE